MLKDKRGVTSGLALECVFWVHPYSPFATPVDFLETLCSLASFFTKTSQIGDFTASWGVAASKTWRPAWPKGPVLSEEMWFVEAEGRTQAGKVFGLLSDQVVVLSVVLSRGKRRGPRGRTRIGEMTEVMKNGSPVFRILRCVKVTWLIPK